jgi:hypothetical protein
MKKRNVYKVLVETAEIKRPTGRTKSRCGHNIKIDLREIGLRLTGFM